MSQEIHLTPSSHGPSGLETPVDSNGRKKPSSFDAAVQDAASEPGAIFEQERTEETEKENPLFSPLPPVQESPLAPSGRGQRWLVRFARRIPTVIVFAALAGIAHWGHHHGWKIPRFSELSGQAPAAQAGWCDEHGVPEAICIACNAELMPKNKLHGWCREHSVACNIPRET
jgi:hypothetical protein